MRGMGPLGTNLFMATGDSTLEEMIASTKRPQLHKSVALFDRFEAAVAQWPRGQFVRQMPWKLAASLRMEMRFRTEE